MCQYCLTSPCPAGCPNADEPEPTETCKHCGDGIFCEDEYVEINGLCYHIECIGDMEPRELLELLMVDVKTAGESEPGYDD